MKERKQDVFNELWRLAAEDRRMTGGELLALQARYVAACKVAVPRKVGEYIDWCKAHDMSLQEAIYPDAYHTTEEIDKLLTDWIAEKSDQFAEAWNHRWVAKEDEK